MTEELKCLKNIDFVLKEEIYTPFQVFFNHTKEKEICHSAIIYELLRQNGKFKLGEKPLKEFFKIFRIFEGIQDDDIQFSKLIIKKEYPFRDTVKDSVTGKKLEENGQIDIIMRWLDKSKVLIIENKMNNAPFQHNQLERYQKRMKREGFKNVKTLVIYRDDNFYPQRDNENVLECTSQKVKEWIENIITGLDMPVSRYIGLMDYINILNKLTNMKEIYKVFKIMTEDDNLCKTIIWLTKNMKEENYSKYFNMIIKKKLSDEGIIPDEVENNKLKINDYIINPNESGFDENNNEVEWGIRVCKASEENDNPKKVCFEYYNIDECVEYVKKELLNPTK